MARITIIVGHSQQGTYCEALGEHYKSGALVGGHEVQLFTLSRLRFDPILRQGYGQIQPLEPDLQKVCDAIKSSNHIVIIFPLWCGDMPAMLKGFLERLIQPDLVRIQKTEKFGLNLNIFPRTSARIIVTMGMPALFYWIYFRGYAVKLLRRNILQFIGMRPVRTTVFGMVSSERRRDRSLRTVELLGRSAR